MSTDEHHHDHNDSLHHKHPDQADEEDVPTSYYRLVEIALRELLTEKGIITDAELRSIHEKMDHRGPHNGARMIARAWSDSEFHGRMREDANAASRELGIAPTWLNLVVLENTPAVHNLVVCTLCSCYPWPLLGLPPDWYKSRAYRSDAVSKPREILSAFGTQLADSVEVRVHDSSADMRYLVMPERPAGTEGWSEEQLARLVTRDSMIGVTTALAPESLTE